MITTLEEISEEYRKLKKWRRTNEQIQTKLASRFYQIHEFDYSSPKLRRITYREKI